MAPTYRRLEAVPAWLVFQGGLALGQALVFVISAVYFVQTIGMRPLELVLVGTVMELTIFVFELPTGIVADLVSRRLSLVIGVAIMGISFVLIGSVAAVWAALAGMALWGLGYTFTSGASDAWLADEIGAGNVRPAYLRGAQVRRIAWLVGIGGAVLLALVSLRLPILAGGAVTVALAAVLALTMREDNYTPAEQMGLEGPLRSALRRAAAAPPWCAARRCCS